MCSPVSACITYEGNACSGGDQCQQLGRALCALYVELGGADSQGLLQVSKRCAGWGQDIHASSRLQCGALYAGWPCSWQRVAFSALLSLSEMTRAGTL